MRIIDLEKRYLESYLYCLEEWSDEMKESGNRKREWYEKMKDEGLRVKLAIDNKDKAIGMIQYIPVEKSFIEGDGLYAILCIWVHGYKKKGVGNRQKKGVGKALLKAAEEDAWQLGAKGMAAWGLSIPVWMKASWYRKNGYLKAQRVGLQTLVWKRFVDDATPPVFRQPNRKPEKITGKVRICCFNQGWCPAQNITFERAKKAAGEVGENVSFEVFDTSTENVQNEWGYNECIYIDNKALSLGPPKSYKKIKKRIDKALKHLKKG